MSKRISLGPRASLVIATAITLWDHLRNAAYLTAAACGTIPTLRAA